MSNEDTPSNSDDAPRSSRRTWFMRGIIATLLLVSLVVGAGTVWLLTSSSTKNDVMAYAKRPPKSVAYVDGLVVKATKSSFDLRRQNGRPAQFCVRPPDRPYIDVLHAQTHAALGQPVRVYWELLEDRRCVVYMEDSPIIF